MNISINSQLSFLMQWHQKLCIWKYFVQLPDLVLKKVKWDTHLSKDNNNGQGSHFSDTFMKYRALSTNQEITYWGVLVTSCHFYLSDANLAVYFWSILGLRRTLRLLRRSHFGVNMVNMIVWLWCGQDKWDSGEPLYQWPKSLFHICCLPFGDQQAFM